MIDEDYSYDEASGEWIANQPPAPTPDDVIEVRDAVDNVLADGDQVTLIKI